MLEERYQAILAAYGANPAKWPEAERAAAMAFAAANPDAANAREEAALDSLLNAYSAHGQSDDAALSRILSAMNAAQPAAGANVTSIASARPVRKASAGWFGERRMMAAGFAFAAMLGLAIGFNGGANGNLNSGAAATADASDELMVSYALAEG